jgi:hypothetical protein
MRKVVSVMMGAALAVALSANVARASHNEPQQAKLQKGEFVKAYVPCNNTSCVGAGNPYSCCTGAGTGTCNAGNNTTSNLFPACTPAIESDPKCFFLSNGKGKYLAKANANGVDKLPGTSDDGDIDLQVSVVNLDPSCNGQVLTLAASVRATTDDCGGASCTVINLNDFALGACSVQSGKCKMKTTVNTTLPGTILPGKRTGICVVGVNLLNGSARTFWGGILAK